MRVQSTRRSLIERQCEWCGTAFLARPDAVAKGWGRFCSRSCSSHGHPFPSAEARFWRNVVRAGDDECWLWTGKLGLGGYGRIYVDGHTMNAHRYAYTLVHGPVPDGLFVCHHCDSRSCCNASHLFVGTHADNMADMVAKGRSLLGERAIGVKLTEELVRAIRQQYGAGGVTQEQLAAAYGVSHSLIGKIVLGQVWRHLH